MGERGPAVKQAPAERPAARRRATAAALLLLLLVPLAICWRAVLEDRVLAPTDQIFTTPFFAGVAPPGFARASNPQLFDQTYQFVPWRHFAWEQIRRGHLPLWNPLSLAGAPFVATAQSAVFYPLNLALAAAPFERTFVLSALVRLWIAGLLTFLLARRTGRSPPAALVAALAFMLCGYMVAWLGHPQTNVAIWLPGLVLGVELVLAATDRRARIRAAGLLALIVGVQFLGGHIETSADIIFGAAVYAIVRMVQLAPARESRQFRSARVAAWRPAPGGVLLLVALVLGVGLAAAQLLPFAEWLPLSEVGRVRSGDASFAIYQPGWWRQLFLLPLFVFPNLYGNPSWPPPYFDFLPFGRNYHADVLYAGVLPFLLALLALPRWRTDPYVRAWTVLAVVALGRALHVPVFDWLNDLPLLRLGKAHMLRLDATFGIAMLAGHGADRLFAASREAEGAVLRRWSRLCAAVVIVGWGLLLAGRYLLPHLRDQLQAVDREIATTTWQSYGGAPRSDRSFTEEARGMAAATLRAFHWRNGVMYAPAVVAAAALALALLARRRALSGWPARALPVALPLLIAADLAVNAYGFNPTVSVRYFYPRPPGLDMLRADRSLFRVSASRRDLVPDAQMMFGLSDVRGLDFPTHWLSSYAQAVPGYAPWIAYGITFRRFDSPLLRVLNVKYVYASGDSAAVADARPIGRVGNGELWEVGAPVPRSFVVHRARAAASDEAALAALSEAPESVFSRVLLAGADAAVAQAANAEAASEPDSAGVGADAPDAATGDRVTLISYAPDRAEWRVRTTRAGWLFTGDAYYPGWTAERDGRPTRIYRANVAFRAVRVPPGDHLVRYRFRPRSVYLGLGLGALSLVAVAGLIAAGRRRV
ncbi:MAG TPA: YfhO family protein [Gemmatimonadales bacterium]|nr:YfhO family protein [Gemmatimonadales bacterium]